MEKLLNKLNIKTVIFVVVVNLLLMFALIFSYLDLDKKQKDKSLETRLINSVLSNLKNAETNQRGYLLTLNDEYLHLYDTSLINITNIFNQIKLIHDIYITNSESNLLNKLNNLVNLKIKELNQTIYLAKNNQIKNALIIVNENYGKEYMDEIRKIIDEYIKIDTMELKTLEKVSGFTQFIIFLFMLFELFFVLILLINQLKQIKREKEQHIIMLNQQRLAQQGEMIQMIGHQWRQPLAQISLNAQIIEAFNKDPNDMVKEKIQSIIDVTDYLSNTITDFKNFFSSNKKLSQFSLEELVDDSLNVINHRIENSEIDIDLNLTSKIINGYRTELGQVILAIVNNAIDILEEKDISKKLSINSFDIDEDMIKIIICDNAGGISSEVLPFIFDPYFSTKSEKNGTGLGLYMSKMIIEDSFNGTIKAQNQDDGACFIITIPNKRETE